MTIKLNYISFICFAVADTMEWTDEHDVLLGREILLVDPFKAKPRTSHRGQLWTKIADALNGIKEPKFSVSQRSVRDRFNRLADKFKKKIVAEERGSGISPEMSELDVLLEEILALERKYSEEYLQETAERTKKDQEDKENAEDMRLKAMETLKETQKRKANADGNDKREKRRSNGSEALKFLREKMDNEKEYREKELDMRKRDVEQEEKKGEREEKRHQDMIQMMQMQQQQMQQMQMNFLQSQAQQQRLLISVIVGGGRLKNSDVVFPYIHVMQFLNIPETIYILPTALKAIFKFFLKSMNLKLETMSPKSHSTDTRTLLILLLKASMSGLGCTSLNGACR